MVRFGVCRLMVAGLGRDQGVSVAIRNASGTERATPAIPPAA